MRIHYLQHQPEVTVGYIETWAHQNGCAISATKFYEKIDYPSIDDFDLLIILGGEMNADEDDIYNWMKEEKEYIRNAIETGKSVLGICLGAQLLARVLNAKVEKNVTKELGWHPITFTADVQSSVLFKNIASQWPTQTVFHWHGDIFNLPQGAIRIASSACSPNQGFVYRNNVVGIQFHPEMTPESIKILLDYSQDDLALKGPYIQTKSEIYSQAIKNIFPNNAILDILLNNFAKQITSHNSYNLEIN